MRVCMTICRIVHVTIYKQHMDNIWMYVDNVHFVYIGYMDNI
jgi:predicted phosphatase